jgi:hypothetical protein
MKNPFLTLLDRNSKIPPKGTSWKENITDAFRQHEEWMRDGKNLGYPLFENRSVCVDFDDKEKARAFWREYATQNIFNVAVVTRRGLHVYFRGETRTRKLIQNGEEIGDIKGNGYCVWPPSVVDGHTYRFVSGYEFRDEMLPFPESLFPDRRKEVQHTPADECDALRRIIRARLWLAKREPAVSKQGGHNTMFYSCCALFQKFGLAVSEAWPLILEYNERCLPPFSESELRHKILDASQQLSGAHEPLTTGAS